MQDILLNIRQYISSNNKAKLVFLVAVLSLISYNHAFNFYLYADDWYQIIGALHYPEILTGYTLGIHPVSVLEFKLFSGIFRANPYPWQFLGYLLKIIDSLSMWPFMIALTNSKKAAFYACLIFSVFVVGMESVFWVSPHTSAIIIPLMSLGFYFYVKSFNLKISRYFFYALAFFGLSILAEPGRAYMAIVVIVFWEIMTLYQKVNLKNLGAALARISLIFFFTYLMDILVSKFFGIAPQVSSLLKGLEDGTFTGWVYSLRNLFFGWTLIPEQFTFWGTILSFIIVSICLILFIWKKLESYKIIIFLYFWMAAFYLPNFLTQAHSRLGVPMESRYYAISAVGLVGLLAYGFSFIRIRNINLILIPFLIFNLYLTNNILLMHSVYRSAPFNNRVWNKIDQDIPKGELVSIFMYTGADFTLRSKVLDYADSIPFALKRGIINKYDYPIVTNDKNLIARLVCEKNVSRHSPFGDIVQKDPIPLSHIHAWEFKDGKLVNRSEQERDNIKRITKCLQPH